MNYGVFSEDEEFIQKSMLGATKPKINPALLAYLLKKELHYLLAPKEVGGRCAGYHVEFSHICSAAKLSPRFGWLVFQFVGNLPRVFSLLGTQKSKQLIYGNPEKLIVSYDTNPHLCSFNLENGLIALDGQMNFGTLSTDATHFGFSGFVNLNKKNKAFCLVERSKIDIIEKFPTIPGTGTCSYKVKSKMTIPQSEIINLPNKVDNVFSNYFSNPRSPIKHIAWSTGCLKHLSCYSPHQYDELIDTLIHQIEKQLISIDKRIINNIFPQNYTSQFEEVLHGLQSIVYKLLIKLHLSIPSLYIKSRGFYDCYQDITLASLHTTMRANYKLVAKERTIEEDLMYISGILKNMKK